jgi:hypothetical protein
MRIKVLARQPRRFPQWVCCPNCSALRWNFENSSTHAGSSPVSPNPSSWLLLNTSELGRPINSD